MGATATKDVHGSGGTAVSDGTAPPRPTGEPVEGNERDWTGRLARVMHRANAGGATSRLHTTLSCDIRGDRPVLFLPPEMGTLQPRSLGYLRAFARRHGFGLVENRRRADIRPIVEQRDRSPSELATGIGLLLEQSGMPGGARTLSRPHRLNADGLHVELDELVRMAARGRERSKRVVMLPNRPLVDVTGADTHPIVGRACRVESAAGSTVLSQFESPAFRCLGYSTGRQYVVHVFLAGGLANDPELWSRLHTLTRTDFRFRLFPAGRPAHDFGLFHATFHFDVADGEDAPWWLSNDDAARDARSVTLPRPGRRGSAHAGH